MITLIPPKHNTLTLEIRNYQAAYDDFIKPNVHLCNLTCTCGNNDCLTKHGYYFRTIITFHGSFRLKIVRVKCSLCNCTHAIMVPCIVPYSQVLLCQQIEIINDPLNDLQNLMIPYGLDESRIRYIKKQYMTYWKQLLETLKIIIDNTITTACFHYAKKQFMQIRNTKNISFIMSG